MRNSGLLATVVLRYMPGSGGLGDHPVDFLTLNKLYYLILSYLILSCKL